MKSSTNGSALFVPTPIPNLSLRERSEWLLGILDKYPELDRTQSSRFALIAKAVLKDGPDIIPSDRGDFLKIVQAEKDLRELYFFWCVVQPTPEDSSIWKKLKIVFGDDPLPSQSSSKSSARDYQFELFSFAMLTRAGLCPNIQNTGADFQCQLGTSDFVVETKRITSLEKLSKRIKKGARQIESSGLSGVLFVDYSVAVNPGDQIAIYDGPIGEQIDDAQQKRFECFWRNKRTIIKEAIGQSRVLSIIFFDHLIMQEGLRLDGAGDWGLCTIRDIQLLPDSNLGRAIADAIKYLGLPRNE